MIAIVDYEAGNLTSVKRALDYLEIPSRITPNAAEVLDAERIIFPGVGHAASAVSTLKAKGLDTALRQAFSRGTPILGICLGTQIILTHSEEGDTTCLGLLEGNCPRFSLADRRLKIPHMGWNSLQLRKAHPIMRDIQNDDEFYFVHSYYPQPADTERVYATSEHGIEFPAAIGYKNLFATQFHPEKSGERGLGMLKNFAEWDGQEC